MQWSNDDAAVTPSTQYKTRVSHRQRTSRLLDTGTKRKPDTEVLPATGDKSAPANLRRKPPVAARPAALNLKANAASDVLAQRRQTCPPGTLDIAAIHVDRQLSEGSTHQPQVDVDHQRPTRTCSQTSASSDIESGSGDSSTSGFSSGGSDVSKAAGSNDENGTATLRRNSRSQKPAVKPKRTSCNMFSS